MVIAHLCWTTAASAQTVIPGSPPSTPNAPQETTPSAPNAPPSASQTVPNQGAAAQGEPQAPTTSPVPPVPGQVEAPAEQPAQPARPPRKLDKAALDEAKRAYAAGEMAYQAGDYKSAIQNFRDAQAILPSPQAAYWLALSLSADRQVPEAIAELKALLASPSADKIGPEKLATANATLEALNKTPGTIGLSTEPAGATVGVDGEVRPGVTPLDVELAPGTHTLTLSLPGYQSMEFELDVPPGSKGEQTLTLVALPPPPPAVAGEMPKPAETKQVVVHPSGTAPSRSSKAGMYVVFGVAAAGLVTGSIFGIRALNDDDTSGSHLHRDTIIAEIGLGVAVTFGIAGLVMAINPEELPGEGCPAARAADRTKLAFAPYLGRDGGGAAGIWRF